MATTIVQFPPWYFIRAPGQYFDEFGVASAAASATNVQVVSFQVPDNHWGLLLGVAFEAGQLTNWFYGNWRLLIGDAAHSIFNDVRGMVSRITEPVPVWKVVKGGQVIQVQVTNENTAVAFQYGARLFGYVQERKLQLAPGVDMEWMT
jgi:hypothetical protein